MNKLEAHKKVKELEELNKHIKGALANSQDLIDQLLSSQEIDKQILIVQQQSIKNLENKILENTKLVACTKCDEEHLKDFMVGKLICLSCDKAEKEQELVSLGYLLCDCCGYMVPPDFRKKITQGVDIWDICINCKGIKELHYQDIPYSSELFDLINESLKHFEEESKDPTSEYYIPNQEAKIL